MSETTFKPVDSKEIRIQGWKDRYKKLNGKFKTTVVILLVILAGGAYAFIKNETERAKAVAAVKEAQRVADSIWVVRTDSIARSLINLIVPIAKKVDELDKKNKQDFGMPGDAPFRPLKLDTVKIYEQLAK